MLITLIIIIALVVATYIFFNLPKFGKLPSGARLERIKKSPNYRDGAFQNLNPTPSLAEGASYSGVLKEFFFNRNQRLAPVDEIPSIKTDLLKLDKDKDILVWFGHSSYFIQVDGRTILVDPVFSGAATPLPFGKRAFKGADIYGVDDMPEIDYLFITHDHWDHLDYETIIKLKLKVKQVICSLGAGAHLERWGYDMNKVVEKDWNEQVVLEDGFIVNTVPARHFAGRGFTRNKTLWLSYVLQTPSMKIFLGGDSGYDTHFAMIGNAFGPFDLAILENGQYGRNWPYIHMLPGQISKAARDLRAKRVLPVHSSKFALANHPWDEPLIRVAEDNKKENFGIITPMIGEPVNLKDNTQQFSELWKGIN